MSPLNIRALTRFRLTVILASLSCGALVLAVSNKVLSVSADKGTAALRAQERIDVSVHAVPAAPTSVAASSLRGTLSLNGSDQIDEFTISTYNAFAQLETVVRHVRQNGRISESRPRLSRDGKKIVYTETGPDGYNDDVYVMNADGSNPVNLSDYPSDPDEIYNCRFAHPNDPHGNPERCRDTWAAWAPDGEHIAFISGRSGRDELYVMNADGRSLRLLPSRLSSAPNNEAGRYGQPAWSPDGSKIAYSYPTDYFISGGFPYPQQTDIAVLSLELDAGGNFVVTSDLQLTSHPLSDLGPAWSPDGSKISFYRYYPSNIFENSPSLDIYVMNADGSNQVNLTNTTDRFEYLPVWSPDGSKIAFTSEIPDPERNLGRVFFNHTKLIVLDLNSQSEILVQTRAPRDIPYSWVDPCGAPTEVAAKSANLASLDDEVMLAHAPSGTSANSTPAAPQSSFKCIKEIVVNVTTDDPDTDTTDEFCDSDASEIGNQCSLRAAIQESNARPDLDFITFDIPGDGLHTIAPTSELPDLTDQVAIDATTQPGYAENAPVVELSGANAGAANGFNVRTGGVRIAGLIINRFAKNGVTDKGNGIYALDTSGLRVQACFIGTDATGTAAAPNHDCGVYLRNTADSTIGGDLDSNRNLISGNGLAGAPGFGVSIIGAESNPRGGNKVIGNRIGTDRTGANALGNKSAGVLVTLSTHNQIGGETEAPGVAPGNLISGDSSSASAGVFLLAAQHTTVAGNLIGTDVTGTKGFGNGIGISLSTESKNNTIGGNSKQARNVISGNKLGVDLFGAMVNDNEILNNYVGTDITGLKIVPITGVADYPQQRRGITVEGGSRNQVGNGSKTGNVVAGNAEVQISVLRPEATDNQLTGNYVGLFADGLTSPTYDPREIGIWILGATKTIVGDGGANVISGNSLGVFIANPTNHASAENKLLYNYIGTNATGTAARPNAVCGVVITKSSNNLVEGNTISGNGGCGIGIANDPLPQTSSAALGSESLAAAYPASTSKISASSALSNSVALLRERGASAAQQEKGGYAAQPDETAETKNNVLIYNYIGTDKHGETAIPNGGPGVLIGPGANENFIGKPGKGNIISGNNGGGILIGNLEQSTLSPTANEIQGNTIGLNDGATAKVPNISGGIGILFGADTIIGGDTEEAGNVIAGNGFNGIAIVGTSNTVRFNFIGTNREGALNLGNAGDGIKLEKAQDQDNEISDNTIAGNGGDGIYAAGTSGDALVTSKTRNSKQTVLGKLAIFANSIGVFPAKALVPAVKIPNLKNGIELENFVNASLGQNPAGGLAKKMIISGNLLSGIKITGANSSGNIISNSVIGTDEDGTANLGNGTDGVQIVDAPDNTVGGENTDTEQNGNIIAGNGGNGIAVEGAGGGANRVQGNFIGVLGKVIGGGQLKAIVKLPNFLNGIKVQGANGTVIGAIGLFPGPAQQLVKNIIGSNGQMGVLLTQAQNTSIKSNLIGTDDEGTLDLGNGSHGVLITGGSGQTIVGGPEDGSGNTITDNDGSGVRIDETGGVGNLVDPNSIYGNHAYGIDLGRRGHTPNDFGDADIGPNRLQNYPEIISREVNGDGHLIISYRLTSAPANSNYGTAGIYIEFFKADPSGEGEKFLAFTHYTVADFNNGAPVVKQIDLGSVVALGISSEDPVTATASDASGNTSEFSPPYSSRILLVTRTDDTNNSTCQIGNCSLREALAAANAGDEIQFAAPLFDSAQTITLNGELVVGKSVKVTGKGAHLLTISANNQSRVFNITDGAMPTLSGLTITKGNALGGFIGGGILNGGTLTLIDCHVSDNIADRGAGIYNTESLIVQSSTVSLNKANLGSATPAGGGIQSTNGGVLSITNSTISGNEARVSDGGGGIYIADGTADIRSSTITNNSAPQGASNAGGIKNKDGSVTIGNSIVAGNTAAGTDVVGTFTSEGYNLVGVGDAAAIPSFAPGNPNARNDIVGTNAAPVDPLLDALADYGGTTLTHRLRVGSPAIDKGKGFGSSTDQRGSLRPIDDLNIVPASGGDNSDIGAFERQEVTPAPAPTLDALSDLTLNEDSPQLTINLSGISAGGGSSQALSVTATSNNPSLIPNPAVSYSSPSNTGSLGIKPVADRSGSALITITVMRGGGGDNSITRTFTVMVNAVNDAPSFTRGADQTVSDPNPQNVNNWATNIQPGPADEATQTLDFQVSNGNNALFSAQPAISPSGTLAYTPVAGANGSTTVTVKLHDSGGVTGGGVDTSAAQTFTITVHALNNAPTLDALNSLTIDEDASSQQVNLTGITSGPAYESDQTMTVTATSSNTGVVPNPSVTYTGPNTTGAINFTPVANANGSAIISVTVTDNGGTVGGGVNTITRTFTITVTPMNDAPTNTVPADQSTNEGLQLSFDASHNNLIMIADVDADANPVQVFLTATNGTLSMSGITGLSFTTGDGANDATVTFTGTVANINSALNGLVFTPTPNYDGPAAIQITTNDQGNTGTGGALSDTDTINITVNNVTPLIQLSSATYSVNEDGLRTMLTVNRSGDISQPATIGYSTNDQAGLTPCNVFNGTASPRCDYATSIGTLRFAAGESSRTISIPIVNDVYVEGAESFTLTLNNASGGELGTLSTATVTINDNDSGPAANPIDNNEMFLRLHYMDFLGREPEPAGLQGWLDVFTNCGTTVQQPCDRIEISSAFFRSEEFQSRGYFIYRLYSAVGKIPLYEEFMPDLARVSGFLSAQELEANKVAFVNEFMTRQVFQNRYGAMTGPTAYVDSLLQTVGLPNHPGRQGWIDGLTNNSLSRAQVLRAVVESGEVFQKYYTEAFVIMQYFGYLRRSADISYLQWIQTMNENNGDYRTMINGFLNSLEYRGRFGP